MRLKSVWLMLVVLGALVLAAAPARAADVDGKWTGPLDTPMGSLEVTFNFKADGSTLTGTTGIMGMDTPIKNGKIDGDKISFVVSIYFGGMAFDLNYTGVVKPDQVALTIDVAGMQMNFTVKKAQ